ncbi:MAG: division/cell wall cluster transcriptional repressor MraZ [Actinomycetales bacterium]|nr:division/cell wall cluster transcriptional repressor MraZ [Actinomycetales bacterium]
MQPLALLGSHTLKLDDKGRFIIPAKLREQFAAGLVITKGQENCLYVFSIDEFNAQYEKLRQAPLSNANSREYLRVFLAGASQDQPDKQSRVNIPASLRAWAKLDKDLVINGAGNHAEIWNLADWIAYEQKAAENFSNIQEEVIPGLF